MKKTPAILTLALLLALLAAGWTGLNASRFEQRVQALESQLASAKGELAAMRTKNAELQELIEKTQHRLQFADELPKFPHCETGEQLAGLPACVLNEARNQACIESFKDSAGKPFCIAGPGATAEVAEFIQTLENGKSYSFPAAFIEFRKKRKQSDPPKLP